MSKGLFLVVFVLIAALGVGLAYSLSENQSSSEEIGRLRRDLAKRPAPTVDTEAEEPSRTVSVFPTGNVRDEALYARVELIEKKVKEFTAWKKTAEPLVGRLEEMKTAGSGETAEEDAVPAMSREELKDMIDTVVQNESRNASFGGQKKPPFSKFSRVLRLTDDQAGRVKEAVFKGQRAVLEFLKTPRADGTSFADDFADAFLSGDEARVKKTFAKLLVTRVPGRETTFFQEVMKISESVKDDFKGVMSEKQFDKYEASGIEPMDVQIKGNPIEVYIMERVQQKQAETEDY